VRGDSPLARTIRVDPETNPKSVPMCRTPKNVATRADVGGTVDNQRMPMAPAEIRTLAVLAETSRKPAITSARVP
jgi:hypothetical protein